LAEIPGDDWSIERLGSNHDPSIFNCGNSVLSDWLKLRASQFEKRDLARTYVATRRGETVVLGYYAISNHRVTHKALPADQAKGLPRLDVPVVLLGCLAVDGSAKGRGLGSLLLLPRQGSSACCCILTRRASEGNAPDPSLALRVGI
jgi:hypothetical protein